MLGDLFFLRTWLCGGISDNKKSQIHQMACKQTSTRLLSLNVLAEILSLYIMFYLPFTVRFCRWKGGVQRFWEKCLVVKV